jgi:hypothetical protein
MAQEWPRRAIGKLVQVPGGPIQGPDYQTTARSPDFPEVGAAVGFPALGIMNQENWSKYPRAWAGGGLYLRPQVADGTVYLVASRVRPYREYPERPNSRDYVETLHAVHPVASLDFPSLFQLPDRLLPVSLTAVDRSFAHLVLDVGRPVELPKGWFAQSREMLVALVAGSPLDAHDYALPAEEYFARALRAVACLPGAVRWRVAIAAGVYAVPPADKAGVRYALALSLQSRGAAGPVADAAGEAYARWFEAETGSGDLCQTIQDLLRVVDETFPDLTAWDAMPVTDSGEVAVKALAEMRHCELLKAWIQAPNGPAPRLDHFLHLRPDVLDLAAGTLDGPAVVRDALLSGVVGSDWKTAWQRCAPPPGTPPGRMAVAGQLLGTLSPLDPTAIDRVLNEEPFELPADQYGGIRARLSTSLDTATGGAALAAWEGLLRRAFHDESPGWLAAWVKASAGKILWRAVRLRFVDRGIDVTTSWDPKRFPGAPAAVQALVQGRPPEESDFEKLLGVIADADGPAVPHRLVEHSERAHLPSALRLALAAGHDRWLVARLGPDVVEQVEERWIRATATVAGSHRQRQPDRRLDQFLFSAWKRLTPAERVALRSRLRRDLGPLDSILFGNTPPLTSEVAVADWVWPIVRKLCETNPEWCRNLLKAACAQPTLATPTFQAYLLNAILARADLANMVPESCETLRFALDLREGRETPYPLAQGRELEAAGLWRPLLEGPLKSRPKPPPLLRLEQFPIAVLYRRSVQPFPPEVTAAFRGAWLRMVAGEQREEYWDHVKDAGLENQAFWRFAAGWTEITNLSDLEIAMILQGHLEDYLRAVLDGAPLPLKISLGLTWQTIANICKEPAHCRTLYRRCKCSVDPSAAIKFWKCCLQAMEADLQELRREVGRGPLSRVFHELSQKLLGRKEAREGWLGLALEIYQSSSEPVKAALDDVLQQQSEWRR